MAQTTRIKLSNQYWTNVSQAFLSGFISNVGPDHIYYREDDTQPADTETQGHGLNPKAAMQFCLNGLSTIWMRGSSPHCYIYATYTGGVSVNAGFTRDFYNHISSGHVDGMSTLKVSGANFNVGLTFVDLWQSGNTKTLLQEAEQISINSTSALDTNGTGTGAWTVFVAGLDQNFEPISETVTLLGLTPVLTVQSFRRINQFKVLTAGAYNSTNQGDIIATGASSGNIVTTIGAGGGIRNDSFYCTAAGEHAFLIRHSLITENGKESDVHLVTLENELVTPSTGPYKASVHAQHWPSVTGMIEEQFRAQTYFEPLTDMWYIAKTTAGLTSVVTVNYELLLVDGPVYE